MPTQAQIDETQKRTKAHTGTIGFQVKSGGIHDLSTSFIVPPKEFPRTGNRPIQDSDIDFAERDRIGEEGGSGLPEGYVETDVILCVNGAPVYGQFLFKEDDPQP